MEKWLNGNRKMVKWKNGLNRKTWLNRKMVKCQKMTEKLVKQKNCVINGKIG